LADITVSVVLPTYNRARYLGEAIDSLLAQTRPPDEIIVVDDHSTDETGQVLDRYAGCIRLIRKEKNEGTPAALNLAIPLAKGSHIWIFDDDDVALPDALAAHVGYLASRPDIDFSYSDKFVYNGDDDIWNRAAWQLGRLAPFPPEEFLVRTMESMNTLMQGMLIPARCYHAAGPFDEAIQRCEDHDMLLRLGRRFRAGNVGQPTFVYRDHAGARGSVADRHAGDERFAVLFRYRQQIFRRVRAEFPLCAYLPGYRNHEEPTGMSRTQALLQRSCIMFRQGLIDEGAADLQEAVHGLPNPLPKDNWLPLLVSRTVDIDPWTFHDRWRLLRCINHALGRDRGLHRAVRRGLYWNIRRAVKRGDWTQAMQSLQMLYKSALSSGAGLISMPTAARGRG
jgi:glycosyltransferase involved in cell wall biosynthesis